MHGGVQSAPEALAKRAKAALICGIIGIIGGLFVIGVPLAIIGVVQGTKARRELDRIGDRSLARSNANTGVICGWVGIGLAILIAIAAAAGVGS
jgi:hypothetical protein